MALTEQTTLGPITLRESGHVEVRVDTTILRDGDVVTTTYHRHTIPPGADLTGQHPAVAKVATAHWTPAMIAAYRAAHSPSED